MRKYYFAFEVAIPSKLNKEIIKRVKAEYPWLRGFPDDEVMRQFWEFDNLKARDEKGVMWHYFPFEDIDPDEEIVRKVGKVLQEHGVKLDLEDWEDVFAMPKLHVEEKLGNCNEFKEDFYHYFGEWRREEDTKV